MYHSQTPFYETFLNRTRGTQTERAFFDDSRTSDLPSDFVPPTEARRDCAEAKRSGGWRKRQPQERQHSADAGTAAGRGTDCSRETG